MGLKDEDESLDSQFPRCVVCEVRGRRKTRARVEKKKKGKAGGDAYVIICFSLAPSCWPKLQTPSKFLESSLFARVRAMMIR